MLKGKNLMLKITNRGTGNKRIRLTALDTAMSNIDDSVGAVAKDGKDVLICLAPMVEEIPPDDDDEVQEPLWDIKYKVNGEWVYEVTGPVVEVSDTRNSQYRGLATELVVSDRVTEIGYLAFRYWSNLVRVDLGNTVRSISNYAFEACTGLKDIVFSNSLEVIGDSSFGGCQSLKVLDFGENLQTINSWALVNLYKLHTIVFRSNTIPTFKSNVFGNGSSGGTNPQYVYAPDHLVNEYYHALENKLLNLRLDGSCKPLSQYTG